MIRVFPRKTKWTPEDSLCFVGDPPIIGLPEKQPVKVSVVFTWDIPEGQRLSRAWSVQYDDVAVGGPAFDDPGGEFVPGLFVRNGVTITSRGCNKHCPWCFAQKREGAIRELKIHPGHIIQDNNLLACSRGHIESVFEMLSAQKKSAKFSGGIDATLLKSWHRALFDSIRINEIWLACDTWAALKSLESAAAILDGISINKLRCYTMIGFNGETLAKAERRLERVYHLGFLPFCQLFQPPARKTYSHEWKSLARKWSRPAAYRGRTEQLHRPDAKQLRLYPFNGDISF
jgi:hypothetical protein